MSDWAERKALVAVVLIVAGCLYFSIGEMRYMIWGRTVDAAVLRMERVTVQKDGRMPYPQIECDYEFADGGGVRREADKLAEDWPIAKGTIAVQYIPGSTSSRVKGNDHTGWLWVSGVVVILGCMAGFVFWKFRDAT